MHLTLPNIRDVVNETRFRTQQKPFIKTKIFSCCYVLVLADITKGEALLMIPSAVIDIVVVVIILFLLLFVDAVRCVHGWFALLMIPFPLMRNEDGQHSIHQKISTLHL